MYHDLYMGEDPVPRIDQFDLNLNTGKMLGKVVEALANEKTGDELVIVVRSHNFMRKHD